jgi:phosphonoacetaldehyde hydrolase
LLSSVLPPGEQPSLTRIKAVVFDWAGTLVDFGAMAPLEALAAVLADHHLPVSEEELRGPMGLAKGDHLRILLQREQIAAAWQRRYGRPPTEEDVLRLSQELEARMPALVAARAKPLPGAVAVVERLRSQGIAVAATTGYTRASVQALLPLARQAGLTIETVCTPEEVGAGRPAPWMLFEVCRRLQVYPPATVVKVGDTLQDIYEGLHAGVWTVAVVVGSNVLGLSEEAWSRLEEQDRQERIAGAKARFRRAGAHFVIEHLDELEAVLSVIAGRLTGATYGA